MKIATEEIMVEGVGRAELEKQFCAVAVSAAVRSKSLLGIHPLHPNRSGKNMNVQKDPLKNH